MSVTGGCFPLGLSDMGKLFSKHSESAKDKYCDGQQGVDGMHDVLSCPRQLPPAHDDSVTCVAPVSAGRCLSGSADKSVVMYNFEQGIVQCLWRGHTKAVTKVVWCHAICAPLSSSRDATVMLWRKNSEPATTFHGHELVVSGVDINPDNTRMMSGSRDNCVRLWDVETATCLLHSSISRNLVTDLKWSENGEVVVQTSEDKEVRLWDSRSLKVVMSFPRKQYIQTSCDITPDACYCLTASNGFQGSGCEVSIWDVRAAKLLRELRGHTESVNACRFVPECVWGSPLVVSVSTDGTLRLWQRESGDCLSQQYVDGAGPLNSIAAHENGSVCVSTFNAGVQVFDLITENFSKLEKNCPVFSEKILLGSRVMTRNMPKNLIRTFIVSPCC